MPWFLAGKLFRLQKPQICTNNCLFTWDLVCIICSMLIKFMLKVFGLTSLILCPKVFYAVHDLNFRQKEFRLHKPRCSGDNLLGCAGLIFLKISLKLHRCLFCGDKRLTKHALISCQQWFRLLKPLNSAVKLRGLVSLNLMPISEVYTSFIS